MARKIEGLAELPKRIDTLFLDMFGTLWSGLDIYPGAAERCAALRAQGRRIYVLTNATTVGWKLNKKFADRGLIKGAHYDDVVCSGDCLHRKIAAGFFEAFSGKADYRFYIIGRDNPYLFESVLGRQTRVLAEADFVYVGALDLDHRPATALDAFRADMDACVARGMKIVCANPDYFAFVGDVKAYAPGSVAQELAERGLSVAWIGKPYPDIYAYALRFARAPASRCAMVGDTLRTDIKGGADAGMKTILITGTGMTADDVGRGKTLRECFADAGATPDYLLEKV
ncbi:MAG: TIGR01459 family HAD-type hydrolase [Alphaproteobacteria bacterium]|nr:TIGR01459 family HAD-type hydrolase [Alphaproteobacteria bacterium]